ncbi:methyl-accepting chemotaxis protein [Rhizobium alvei]|uniref:HAMP domain-containing methyl-accepting chemotaxis protein n=1 Tax=Rhizobium alvei TaxID=1132659 RepID=A0ABT8YG71_9HYPH|nr:HAMP domain-containing methyl-accepting chemotaxis protein [Rhizobium alvei]MDO6962675.1 HAMP domain-containing methyl-accepting chemotaxis protein [Rhizobium alvei]
MVRRILRLPLVIQILISVAVVLVLGEVAKVSNDLRAEWERIEANGEMRGNAALDMLEAVHIQAMLNRGQIEDGDPAIATLDGAMEQFSHSNQNIDIWVVMAPKVEAFQKENGQKILPPKDELDRRTLTSLTREREVSGNMLRLTRPVVLGAGTAADERCAGCHEGMMNITAGEPLGVYSAAIDMSQQISLWYADVQKRAIAGFLTLAVTLAVIMLLLRMTVLKPLRRLAGATDRLAAGDVDCDLPAADRNDEIGAMGKALGVFRAALQSKKALEVEAEQSRQRAEQERIDTQRKAEAAAAERLRIATSGLADGLKQLASGDLAFQLTQEFSPEFEALRSDFNASVQQLGRTLAAISQSVGTIDGGTSEISQGTNDLSLRTEQQAASLDKTVTALGQITANVASASERASEARDVAARANESAASSAVVVTDAEDAMRRIEQSSAEISKIIGVIDEIAFQTNLLALNAGVEAARAGDAGKGFAVVAQEVRGLAQRSANAAKEIKDLIQNSSQQVDSGVRLVRDAGTALKTIGDYIVSINEHMEAIAKSSKEQASDLEEVNSAVSQMDQVTQQNAAMVEQSNAASATLADETSKLRDLVNQFRLDVPANNPVAGLRATHARMAAPSAKAMSSHPAPARMAVAKASGGGSTEGWEEF